MIFILIHVAAAIIPAIILMKYIYKTDKVEKEPVNLLIHLVLRGCLAGIIAGFLNSIGQTLLGLFIPSDSYIYSIVLAFLVVGIVEEGCKMLMLKNSTWKNENFNFRYDGVVYAVFVSLGFAALENITYVFNYGLGVAVTRAFLSVPAHMGFAIFMGAYYGRAKVCEVRGDNEGKKANLKMGYLISVFLHGFYDSCALVGTAIGNAMFWVFVVLMYIIVIRRIKKESANDTAIINYYNSL